MQCIFLLENLSSVKVLFSPMICWWSDGHYMHLCMFTYTLVISQ